MPRPPRFASTYGVAATCLVIPSLAHGEWEGFEVGMKKIFPDCEIIDIPEGDAIFSIVYGIKQKYQVGNFRSMQRSGGAVTYRADGKDPQWRGIRDDQGRMVAAMTFNNDLGGSWQLASQIWGFGWR